MIYFDNAATSFPKPKEVYEFMDCFFREYGVNVGRGTYNASLKAIDIVEETREGLKKLFKAGNKHHIVFMPSATIAINQVLQGLEWNEGDVVYFSPFEHNAVLRTLYFLQDKFKLVLRHIPVNRETFQFEVDQMEEAFLNAHPRLVVISHVSNVCGLIAPVNRIAELARRYQSEILVDASQSAGILQVDMDLIDYYVFSGHKSLNGPFGIAGLVIHEGASRLSPIIYGGTGSSSAERRMPEEIPERYEAGSLNIHAIAGLNAAIKWIENKTPDNIFRYEKNLTEKLINVLSGFSNITMLIPPELERHFNVVSIRVLGYTPQEIGKILNERFNIAVRTGLHCAPLAHEFLGTLPLGTVRFSLGYFNTEEEIYKLQEALDSFLI